MPLRTSLSYEALIDRSFSGSGIDKDGNRSISTNEFTPNDNDNDGNENKDGEDNVEREHIPSTLLGQERGEDGDNSGCSYSPKKNSLPTIPETTICLHVSVFGGPTSN